MLEEAGVDVLMHSLIVEVRKTAEHLEGVRLATKSGYLDFYAHVFVDTTGDADVALRANFDRVHVERLLGTVRAQVRQACRHGQD